MPYSLGDYANQLQCDMCNEFPYPDPDYYPDNPDAYGNEDYFPDDFWDPPPDPAHDFGMDDLEDMVPDPRPSVGFPEGGGFTIGIEGTW